MSDNKTDVDLLGDADTQGRAGDLKRRAQEALNQGLDTARFQAAQARDYAGQQWGQAQEVLTQRIVERPISSALMALGAGVVLGMLLKGGRR